MSRQGEHDSDDDPALDADARRAREALRALPRAQADPAYRARLKGAFASGSIESATAPGSTAAAAPARTPARPNVVPFPWHAGRGWQAGVALAAAVLVVVLTGVANQGPAWRIAGARGEGTILLDGKPMAVSDAAALGRLVPAGVRVEVTDGAELDLRADGVMAMRCTGGTDLILPPSPPRWFARRAALHVRDGEIRVTTGPAFKGASLAVTTPDAALAVTGTTFAVILEPTGTCVCVYEGMVRVGPRDGPGAPVTGGRRRYVFRDGRPIEDASMRESEHEQLAAFWEQQKAAMETR